MAGNDKYTPFTQFELSVDLNEGVGGAKAQTYLNQYIQAIKNLTDESRAFASEIKRAKDKLTQTVYVEQSMQGAAQKAFSNVRQRQTIMQDEDFIIPTSFSQTAPEIEQSRFTRKINDKYRRADVASYVARHGGVMEKNPIKEGYYDIIAPRAVIGETPEGDPKYLDTEIKRKIRRINDAKRRKEEEEAQEKIIAEQTKAEESISLGEGYGGSSGSGGSGGGRKIGLGTGMSNRSMLNSVKTGVGAMLVIKGVMEVVKLLAKIYQLVSQFTRQSLTDSVQAEGLGVEPYQIREYRVFEKSKALNEGTITGTLSKINSSFGRLQALAKGDAVFENIATFMQGDLISLVERAKGNQSSMDVMELVFDKVMKRTIDGVGVLGDKKDSSIALIEYIGALNDSGVFAGLSPLLERFFFEYNNPNLTQKERDAMKEGGFSKWLGSTGNISGAAGVASQDIVLAANMKALMDEISALTDSLKEGIAIKFTDPVTRALAWIEKFLRNFSDSRSASEKVLETRDKLYSRREEAISELNDLNKISPIEEDIIKGIQSTITTTTNKGIISPEVIRGAAQGFARGHDKNKYGYIIASLNKEGQELFNQIVYFETLRKELETTINNIDKQLKSSNPAEIPDSSFLATANARKKVMDESEKVASNIKSGNFTQFMTEDYGNILSPLEKLARASAIEKKKEADKISESNKFAWEAESRTSGLNSSRVAEAKKIAHLAYSNFIENGATADQKKGTHIVQYVEKHGIVHVDLVDERTGKKITDTITVDTEMNRESKDTIQGAYSVSAKMGVKSNR